MTGWMTRIFGRPKAATPRPMLSSDEAIEVARSHAADEAEAEQLQWAALVERDGRKVWVVCESAIGNVLAIEIDDETGRLIGTVRIGVR